MDDALIVGMRPNDPVELFSLLIPQAVDRMFAVTDENAGWCSIRKNLRKLTED